jgi:3-oxoacyl-[acyl-carrier-protein] synthase II
MDDFAAFRPDRSRVSIGTSKGGVITLGQAFEALAEARQGGEMPNADACAAILGEVLPDGVARSVARRFGITGGAHSTVAACATGTLAVIQAARWIRSGEADIVLAGSSDASLTPLWFGAFQRMGVLAKPHPTLGPDYACRPFDRIREGFTIGEGAAVLVLESPRSVARRGVSPVARIAGFAAGADPAGLTAITPDAESLATVLKLALRRGGCTPERLVAVMAHGTGTQANDAAEARALKLALGDQAARIPVVSVKGRIGHLLGAAGSVETALSVLAIFHGRLPGNTTLIEPDPTLGNLNLPRSAIELPSGPILKVSMGFGGHLAAILLAPA